MDLLAPENLRDPYPMYAAMRQRGPHWHDSLKGWALSSFDDVARAVVDPELSAARFSSYLERALARGEPDPDEIELYEGLSRWFNYADPPYHTKLRTLTQKVVLRPMNQARPLVERLIDERLDEIAQAGRFDLVSDLARPVALGTVVSIMGVPPEDFELFSNWSAMLANFVGGALDVPDRRERALEAQRALDTYFLALMEERRSKPATDFIGNMMAVEHPEHGRFTDEEITATSAMMMFAGHGTTTHLIGNMVSALVQHPEQMQMVREDPKLVNAALEETLRWDSPVHMMVRVATRNGAAGVEGVRKGDRMFLFLGAANRDSANGQNYEDFDITRTDGKHLTFGTGIHTCLGAALARVEATALLAKLFARFERIELDIDPSELRWESMVGFRSLASLPLRVS